MKGSLKLTLAITLLFGIVLAAVAFIAVRAGFDYYINKLYLTEENKEERELGYVSDLQEYIEENGLTSEDTKKFSLWAKEQKYVYLMIYKDDELFYSSDMEIEDDNITADGNPGDNSGEAGSEDEGSKDEAENSQPTAPGSGITVNMPSYEELKEYAEKNDLHPVTLADGTLFASVAEFTEYLYYDISNIVSLGAAALAFSLLMALFFAGIINRITRLASDVNRVAGGDMEYSIKARGEDEISKLSRDVENMRSSIIENLERERAARSANEALITSMSHDIRTPLTVLLGYLDVMKMHSYDESMNEYIKASEATALRLKSLSDDMFNYFLVFGEGDEMAELQPYDAETLLSQMLDEHILLMRENGYTIDLETDISTEGASVITDAPKLMRMIDNVFSNLSKYADKSKPIKIAITLREKNARLTFENTMSDELSAVESNRIGLKTCDKIARMLNMGFEYGKRKNIFYTKFTLALK